MPEPPKRSPLVAGALVGGKYRLTRRLGTGAMGVVWAATNELTTSEVALKMLAGGEPELRLRLLREARSCGQLRHRNIIEVYDVATAEDGEPFMVMELLKGQTLAQRLKESRRLDPAEAALIARDVARALAAAHAKHIIHRDLKPANIFLQQDEAAGYVVKVLDFGVSKNLAVSDGLHTQAGAAVGSLAYMSPEQARAEKSVDHRADLWSLGVLLFEMLAGSRPFKGGVPELLMALTREPIPALSQVVRGVDPGLEGVVSRCLQRSVEERASSAAEIARELERYAAPAERGASPVIVDESDSTTLKLAGRSAAPARSPSSPEIQAGGPVGIGGTVRIGPVEAAQIAAAQRALGPRPALEPRPTPEPPPPSEIPPEARKTLPLEPAIPPDARKTLPLRRDPAPMAAPAPAAQPDQDPAAPARAPRGALGVFLVAFMLTIAISVVVYFTLHK